jgi:predicted nucleic-acid-binding protein
MGSSVTCILDTNVLVRFLVGDNKSQQQQATKWFSQAESGKIDIIVKPIVVAEACFVLESFYKISRKDISESMIVFLSQRWLKVENRDQLLTLWPWYLKKIHFVDSFLLAWREVEAEAEPGKKVEILSFDKQLIRFAK